MGRIDNVKANQLRGITRQQKRQATAAPLGSTSVDNGHTEFNGSESLIVKGSQRVSGLLLITGTLRVVGTFILEGITTITGALNINGPSVLNGDLTVNDPGKITIAGSAPMIVGVTSLGTPGVQIGSSVLTAVGSIMGMASGTTLIGVEGSTASVIAGSNSVKVASTGTTIAGDVIANLLTISASGKTPNVWCDPTTKKLYRLI